MQVIVCSSDSELVAVNSSGDYYRMRERFAYRSIEEVRKLATMHTSCVQLQYAKCYWTEHNYLPTEDDGGYVFDSVGM